MCIRDSRDAVRRTVDHGDRIAGADQPWPRHAQVRARHRSTGKRPQPAAFGHPEPERAARYARDGHRQLELVPDPPALADHRPVDAVSYTHLRAHETVLDLVCRLLL